MNCLKGLLLLALLFLAAAAPLKDEAISKDRKQLQGTWQVFSMKDQGAEIPADEIKSLDVVVDDDTVKVRDAGKIIRAYTFTIDPAKKPKILNLKAPKGVGAKDMAAIYKLDGDQLTICGNESGKRPADFDPGATGMLMVLKRAK